MLDWRMLSLTNGKANSLKVILLDWESPGLRNVMMRSAHFLNKNHPKIRSEQHLDVLDLVPSGNVSLSEAQTCQWSFLLSLLQVYTGRVRMTAATY